MSATRRRSHRPETPFPTGTSAAVRHVEPSEETLKSPFVKWHRMGTRWRSEFHIRNNDGFDFRHFGTYHVHDPNDLELRYIDAFLDRFFCHAGRNRAIMLIEPVVRLTATELMNAPDEEVLKSPGEGAYIAKRVAHYNDRHHGNIRVLKLEETFRQQFAHAVRAGAKALPLLLFIAMREVGQGLNIAKGDAGSDLFESNVDAALRLLSSSDHHKGLGLSDVLTLEDVESLYWKVTGEDLWSRNPIEFTTSIPDVPNMQPVGDILQKVRDDGAVRRAVYFGSHVLTGAAGGFGHTEKLHDGIRDVLLTLPNNDLRGRGNRPYAVASMPSLD